MFVFDFGGGTLDVSVIQSSGGELKVRAISGDNRLGGDDIDNLLADHLAGILNACTNGKQQYTSTNNPKLYARLLRAARAAKHSLSFQSAAYVDMSLIAPSCDKQHQLTRASFENILRPLLKEKMMPVVKAGLSGANLKASDIDVVLLIGGSRFEKAWNDKSCLKFKVSSRASHSLTSRPPAVFLQCAR